MTTDAPATGVLAAIVLRRWPGELSYTDFRLGLFLWPGELSYTDFRLGLFLCHDIDLCLLTSVGPQFPRRFPPR
jgi:hypothetical protein